MKIPKKGYIDFIKEFIEKEENNDIACFALNFFGPFLETEIPYLVDITEKLHNAAPESKYINNWYQSMQRYKESVMAEQQNGLPINTAAPDIVLQNPGGDTIQLSNLEGNIVLLDFWASWCQPCRMENPNVVKLYKAYHAKGLEIFSVSLDANAEQWKKAIAKDGLVWKNHGSDFSGWQSPVAQLYKVTSIPATYLLDKKGMIVAKNLRGTELEAKVKELLANEVPNN
ncbi:MAG: TlpA family protein disulfide reductase [Sphingobacteriales bacterium]|nr:TlpA family protein disulfide reductase [Sphingobacteriales bacterium]